ncbi:MAG TPA: GMP synthase (glutamine-hydrolyzing), partial [Gemmatimonadetes bacterium]|nr:GMP synthase (glutamine-hydrolyzing) [Gemmatimonadota bacterium]
MSHIHDRVLILDFGSQFTQLIARRIREERVYCEIHPPTRSLEWIREWNPAAVILSGGPSSVYDDNVPTTNRELLHSGIPVLGICYGMQAMVHQLGGKVAPGTKREYGHAVIERTAAEEPLFDSLPSSIPVWMSHGDR